MKYTLEEILGSFDEPGNKKAVSAEFSADGAFIQTVTFLCEKENCDCAGSWTTKIGRTVAAQMGEICSYRTNVTYQRVPRNLPPSVRR